MALLFHDSFDHYATAYRAGKGWSFVHVGATPGDEGCTIGAFGRNGSNGLRAINGAVSGASTKATLGIPGASGATAILGFAFRVNTALPGADCAVCAFYRGSTELVTVVLTTTGTLIVKRGDRAGTTLSTSGAVVSHSTFYFVELKVLLHDSTGTYDLKVNGTTATSGSGADTLVSGSAVWDGIGFGGTWVGANISLDFDDLYVLDGTSGANNDLLGDFRTPCLFPSTGNGTHADFTCSTGTDHGALVDEVSPDTTDYNTSATVNHVDTLNYPAVGVAGTVKAVTQPLYAKAAAAGTRQLVATVRISGTTYVHATPQALGSDYSYYRFTWLVSPATSTAWTVSEIDGAEFGYKIAA